MLNTDMAIAFPVTTAETLGAPVAGYLNQICGPSSVGAKRGPDSGVYGCTNGKARKGQSTIRPLTLNLVQSYINNNQLFLDNFAISFNKMVTVGYGIAPSIGKLGSLTPIDLTEC